MIIFGVELTKAPTKVGLLKEEIDTLKDREYNLAMDVGNLRHDVECLKKIVKSIGIPDEVRGLV